MRNKKGFTLIEMLVVIAIIAILVAIVVPVVSTATEKAKEAKDAANIRTAIAEVTVAHLTGEGNTSVDVTLTSTGAFDKNAELTDIGGMALSTFTGGKTYTIAWDDTTSAVTATEKTTTPTT